MFQATEGRWGSREAEITGVDLVGEDGQPAHVFYSGERVEIRLTLKADKPLTDFVVGIGIFNVDGVCAFGTNTNIEELKGDRLEGEGRVTFAVDGLDLVAGTYKLDVALHKLDGFPYDYHRLLYSFRVKSRTQDAGIYRPRHSWSFGGGVSFKERVVRDREARRQESGDAAGMSRAKPWRGARSWAARGSASCSPTACSTSSIPATCATSPRPAARATP